MNYILDISCLDTYSSGAKQRFLSLYSELIKDNKKKKNLLFFIFDLIKLKLYLNIQMSILLKIPLIKTIILKIIKLLCLYLYKI